MYPLLVVLLLSPTLINGFSLAFLRTSPAKNQGINWITNQAVPNIESLSKCFPVPFQYFDIAQFIPDNASPEYLTEYKIKESYDPSKNLYWINIPGVSITKVEFYTGSDCKNAVYQQDEEGALKLSVSRVSQVKPQNARQQLPQNIPSIPEEEEDENYYHDFDIDIPESETTEQQIEAQSNVGDLGTTVQEKMDVEPPVDGETQEEGISRQERNFLRFYDDVESDGGIALDSKSTTLQWSENWKSFKFSYIYVPTARSRVTNPRDRDL
ncbi:hypothetical protein TWF730_008311 [Orbilia blumenaviensis]|uniref:Uncharacterized protein n=1 Tax=Orbilia blumenaviensis TaxID=1796055 RepID=A0AAV9V542_9PEZI